jgi:hypothetical protein
MKQNLKDESQNVFIEVEFLTNKNLIYANWIGSYLEVDQVKAGATLVLEQFIESQATSILNDNRQLEGVWDEANEWIANEWMPKAIASGLTKFAHILPDELFAQLSAEFMEDNSKKIEGGFQMRLFGNQEEAEVWLAE